MAATGNYVQVPADGSGKFVRTVRVEAVLYDSEGSPYLQNMELQVVTITDDQGKPVQFDQLEYLPEILDELRIIKEHLSQIAHIDSRPAALMNKTQQTGQSGQKVKKI